MKRAFFAAVMIALMLHAIRPAETRQPDALRFFKNYFVTGDYVVGGVGLRGQGVEGIATGNIKIGVEGRPGVPQGADILAAFLYWQVVSTSALGPDSGSLPVTFKGYPLSSTDGPFGKVLDLAGTPPCWSSGGSTGPAGGNKLTYTYRADVLRFFEIDENPNSPGYGKYAVNGLHQVQLPDSGSGGNTLPIALGASLVVIYRDPTQPLNAIVLYDGGYTLNNSSPTMSQAVKGFYQPSETPNARMTHIVGSAQANKTETLLINGTPHENPFTAHEGESWDNPSFLLSLSTTQTEVTTSVGPSSDCLTWGAVVLKTAVKDRDEDGLLDIWEDSTDPIYDPYGQPLPNLNAMRASSDHKDVFVQIDWMTNDSPHPYGGKVDKPAHSHKPTPAAIKLMGDAFRNAPVVNPDGTKGIRLHIDAGDAYLDPENLAGDYLIRGAGLARGGWALDELNTTQCTVESGDPVWKCQFNGHPGTVGWKTGFRYIRDEVLEGPPPPTDPAEMDPCEVPGNACRRRFDANRRDMFHYALFAHAVGMPKSLNACLNIQDPANPIETPDVDGHCPAPLVENPLYFTPRTNSGIGDFPGGDFMVTLGAFSDRMGRPGGTDFMVASTFVHELGHNLELRHGAWQELAGGPIVPAPNCIPTYLSVMNYLYQLRGLIGDDGRPNIDYSGLAGSLQEDRLDEQYVSDGALSFTPAYRLGWYAPLAGSYFEAPDGSARTTIAGRHCDGSPILGTDAPMVQPMVRVDAGSAAGGIDWNADGDLLDGRYVQDLNFNGRTSPAGSPELPQAFNDWENIRLNQVGGRRNIGGVFIDDAGHRRFGPLSANMGRWDYGRWDYGRWDYGRWDYGRWDYGRWDYGRWDYGADAGAGVGWGDLSQGDYGRWDYGRWDYGRGDDGRGDFGGGDLFVGDPNNPGGCLDHETATLLANTPPYAFTCHLDGFSVHCTWDATNEGNELRYVLYRVEGTELRAGQAWHHVTDVPATGAPSYSVTFEDALQSGVDYLYFATAVYSSEGGTGEVESNPSDTARIVGPNHPPVAVDDSYLIPPAGTSLTGNVLANDTDAEGDSLTAVLVSGPSYGALTLNQDGTFVYTPAQTISGPDAFVYYAVDRGGARSNSATVRIAGYMLVGIQNVPPAAWTVKAKAGSSVPMKWQFKDGLIVLNSSGVHHTVTVAGKSTSDTISDTDPGSSSFRYDATTKTWYFNLQTKSPSGLPYQPGIYQVTIRPTTPGYLPSPTFTLTLTK